MAILQPIPGTTPNEFFDKAERSQIVDYYNKHKVVTNEWIRRQVLFNNRIDLLATLVLGYELRPFHLSMMHFQFEHPDNLQLVYRGSGKSTICTVTKSIHLLLKDPEFRILISSKTITNAKGFLKEIKGHFEENEKLTEIFGPQYDSRLCRKWDDTEIEILPKQKRTKEASITCVGVEGTIVSKHFDAHIDDDLVDEANSQTLHMRDKTSNWYYKVLDPTLEPPDPKVPHRGEKHRQGTRYHYDDLYGRLIENELKNHHNIILAIDENGQVPWPEKHPPEWFIEKKKKTGIIIFNAQYQNNTEAMKGEIFQYDDCQKVDESDLPDKLRIFMGVDLAISEDEQADHFAIVVIGMDGSKNRYVLDWYEGQLRFNAQTEKIKEFYNRWKPIRCCIETNAYQKAQYDNLKDEDSDLRLKAVHQDKDKIARAWKLSSLFEDKKMFFKKAGDVAHIIEVLVLFPGYRYKDLFDALDLAVKASKMKKKRKRRKEPGLI
jgi:predicted phage terminase large subunit-like protein